MELPGICTSGPSQLPYWSGQGSRPFKKWERTCTASSDSLQLFLCSGRKASTF